MDFVEKIDKMISEAQFEMEKCVKLRSNKQRHVEYVSDRINNHIKEVAKNHPDDPTRSLADSLSKVPEFISKFTILIDGSVKTKSLFKLLISAFVLLLLETRLSESV